MKNDNEIFFSTIVDRYGCHVIQSIIKCLKGQSKIILTFNKLKNFNNSLSI